MQPSLMELMINGESLNEVLEEGTQSWNQLSCYACQKIHWQTCISNLGRHSVREVWQAAKTLLMEQPMAQIIIVIFGQNALLQDQGIILIFIGILHVFDLKSSNSIFKNYLFIFIHSINLKLFLFLQSFTPMTHFSFNICIQLQASKVKARMNIVKEQRKFTKPNSISNCLKCTICSDVLYKPLRLFCGHTFCYDCIKEWSKQNARCPICRAEIDQDNVGKDVLAFNMIEELEVFCPYEECFWRGEMVMLETHLSYECLLKNKNLKKTNKAANKQTAIINPMIPLQDEEVQQKINDNINKGSLISRMLSKNQNNKSEQWQKAAVSMLERRSQVDSAVKKEMKKEKEEVQKKQGNSDCFDYLCELYQ